MSFFVLLGIFPGCPLGRWRFENHRGEAREMNVVTAGEILRAAGAIEQGHFVLPSGKHADTYVENLDLQRNPRATQEICTGLVRAIADNGIEVVVGPTTPRILLAFEIARQLGVMAA